MNPLWAGLATGMRISKPGDPSEQEADRIADTVMSGLSPEARPEMSSVPGPVVQRMCSECEDEMIHRKAGTESSARADTGGPAEQAIRAVRSGSDPLPDPTRRYFEPRFGRDFSDVRVHAGTDAGRAAEDLQAQAFTIGNHIAFAPGRYVPGSQATLRLLAHELTHVVQQRENSLGPQLQRQEESEPAPASPGPTLMMAKPPHFPQDPLGCWASAIASWYRVKGFSESITDKTLLNHYKGTDCIDDKGALIGDDDADMEAVFAEWRLLLKISDEVPDDKFTFHFVKRLIENHGHFILATKSKSLMHALVVYGVRWNDTNDPSNFTLFLEDPMAEDNEKHAMFVERPIRVVLGTERSAGPAPCRSRPPR